MLGKNPSILRKDIVASTKPINITLQKADKTILFEMLFKRLILVFYIKFPKLTEQIIEIILPQSRPGHKYQEQVLSHGLKKEQVEQDKDL